MLTTPTQAAETVPDTFLKDLAQTQSFSAGQTPPTTPTPDGTAVLFLRSGPRDRILRLYEFIVATKQTREVLTPQTVLKGAAEHLSVAEKARRERQRQAERGFTTFHLSDDGKLIFCRFQGTLYRPPLRLQMTELPGDSWIDYGSPRTASLSRAC